MAQHLIVTPLTRVILRCYETRAEHRHARKRFSKTGCWHCWQAM